MERMKTGGHVGRKMANKMGSAPYHDTTPPRMPRSVPKGATGDTFRIPSNAKYGVDGIGGQESTRMPRKVPSGKSGNTFSIPAKGPARAARSHKGSNTMMGKSYGVGGVSVKDNGGRYGV